MKEFAHNAMRTGVQAPQVRTSELGNRVRQLDRVVVIIVFVVTI